jgi:hypothetical protein
MKVKVVDRPQPTLEELQWLADNPDPRCERMNETHPLTDAAPSSNYREATSEAGNLRNSIARFLLLREGIFGLARTGRIIDGLNTLGLNRERVKCGLVVAQPLTIEPSTETILNEFIVAGTPDQCVIQLRRIQRGLGADYFSCSFSIGELPQDAILRSMERFARDVMPHFAQGAVQ